LGEGCADAGATLARGNKNAGEVVAAWCCVGGSLRLRLEEASTAVAADHAAAFGDDEMVLAALDVARKRIAPVACASFGSSDGRECTAFLEVGVATFPDDAGGVTCVSPRVLPRCVFGHANSEGAVRVFTAGSTATPRSAQTDEEVSRTGMDCVPESARPVRRSEAASIFARP
jgi:hypothetical protein